MLALSEPQITSEDVDAVVEALRAGWVSTSSSFAYDFAKTFAEKYGVDYALAVNSGTSALHLALIAAGVTKNDLVIAPTLTFIAPINAIRYVGADPVFIGYDGYLNMNINDLIGFIDSQVEFNGHNAIHRVSGRKISALIVVHVFGGVADLDELVRICSSLNIMLVEDSTEALGSRYIDRRSRSSYAGTIGDIGCFSFNGNKLITSGAGGMVVTNNLAHYKLMKYLASQAKRDPIFFEHDDVGYNYLMPGLNASLLGSQFSRLDSLLVKKRDIHNAYARYSKRFGSFLLMDSPENCESNYWLNTIIVLSIRNREDQEKFIEYMQERGVQVRPIWRLNHLQEHFKKYTQCILTRQPNDSDVYPIESYFNVPSGTLLTDSEIEYVCECVSKYA